MSLPCLLLILCLATSDIVQSRHTSAGTEDVSLHDRAVGGEDVSLQDGAVGAEVVLAALTRLKMAAIVSDDSRLLRRIAYVETRDRVGMDNNSTGGIWGVNEILFRQTQAPDVYPLIEATYTLIRNNFGIDWIAVDLKELSKPLYSAIAAQLVLLLAPIAAPQYNDLLGQAQFWRCFYNPYGSVDEFLSAVNRLEGSLLESSGSNFYVGFPHNIPGASQKLLVTTVEHDEVPFTVSTTAGLYFTGTATHAATTEVDLGDSLQVCDSSERHKGIFVSAASKTIVVYGLNYDKFTSDAFLALPCGPQFSEDHYEYYGMSYGNYSGPNQLLLVACADNTTVTIGTSSIVLHKMETYLLEQEADITGMKVVTTKPISFFSGHLCTYIPEDVFACDHIIEQFLPTAVWGNEFLLAPLYGRKSGDLYRIVTSSPSNVVKIVCTSRESLKTYKYLFNMTVEGDWEELALPAGYFCSVESTLPLLVAQFGLAHQLDYIGDPLMMMVPSIQQYSNFYAVSAMPEFAVNYVTILVPAAYFEPENVFFDDKSLKDAEWDMIECHNDRVCGYVTYAELNEGEHYIHHVNAVSFIGVLVYGFDVFNSYGFPGGLQYIPRESTVVSFSQDMYTVRESEGSLNVTILRSVFVTEETVIMIDSAPSQASATEVQDYVPVVQLVVFASEEVEKQIEIEIKDDKMVEQTEMITLYISTGHDVHIIPYAQTHIKIIDDDDENLP